MNKMTRNNETSQDVKNYADEESNSLSNFNQSVCCNPAGTIHRYVVFIFICFLGFGKTTYNKFALNYGFLLTCFCRGFLLL